MIESSDILTTQEKSEIFGTVISFSFISREKIRRKSHGSYQNQPQNIVKEKCLIFLIDLLKNNGISPEYIYLQQVFWTLSSDVLMHGTCLHI